MASMRCRYSSGRGLHVDGHIGVAVFGLEIDGHDLFPGAMVVHREVVDGPVEPGAGLPDGVKMSVQFHERILDEVLRGVLVLSELERVSQQRRLKSCKQLPDGLRLQRV